MRTAYDLFLHEGKKHPYKNVGNTSDQSRLPPLSSRAKIDFDYAFAPIILPGFRWNSADMDNNKKLDLVQFPVQDYGPHSNISQSENTTYYFVGASHMRYNFLAILEFMFGPKLIRSFKAIHKLSHLRFRNLQFNFSSMIEDQISILKRICAKNSTEGKSTVIFQTGAWDLMSFPPLYMFEYHAKKLIDYVDEHIFSSVNSCNNIVHLVWMPTVPYPYCFDDSEDHCENHRGFRNSGSINNLNDYYFNFIKNAEIRSSLKVSYVDAYDIIQPRTILSEAAEKVCNHHYLCNTWFVDRNGNWGSLNIHTPSGDAVVHSILRSLSSNIV